MRLTVRSRVFVSMAMIFLALYSAGRVNSDAPVPAAPAYVFDLRRSVIGGSVKYTAIIRYHCVFEDYDGIFYFDPQDLSRSLVRLEIKAQSVRSNSPTLDNVIRSKRLLDVETYPKIIFESTEIKKIGKAGEYLVKGKLTMRGMTRSMTFPFYLKELRGEKNKRVVFARGKWVINRKDFGIVWNKFLDRGGIVVGNHLTVEWNITAVTK